MDVLRKIMVVEDDGLVGALLDDALSQAGYAVIRATTAAQACQIIDDVAPDLMLLDLGLPVVDGFHVLAQLGGHPRWRSLPIIVLTARHRLGDVERALRLGASGYVTKPFQVRALLERIDNRLSRPDLPTAKAS